MRDYTTSQCKDHLQTLTVQSKFEGSAELEVSCKSWNRLLEARGRPGSRFNQAIRGLLYSESSDQDVRKSDDQAPLKTFSKHENLLVFYGWGLFYGTERNDGLNYGTERNDGLNYGTECFLKLKLAAYHCRTSYRWHFQQVIKRNDKTNLRIDCGFLLVVISNDVLIVGIADSMCSIFGCIK